jgi:hypothetical protein
MAFTSNAGYPESFKVGAASWTNSDAINTKKTIYTAGSDGAVVKALWAASTDTSSRTFRIYMTISGVDYLIGSAIVGASAGASGSASPTSFMPASTLGASYMWDAYGNKTIIMPASAILKAENRLVLTAATQIDVMAQVMEY